MTDTIATTNTLTTTTIAPSQNPAIVYLGSLAEGSRRAMAGALNRIAAIMVDGATLETSPWGMLRYQHTGVHPAIIEPELYHAAMVRMGLPNLGIDKL